VFDTNSGSSCREQSNVYAAAESGAAAESAKSGASDPRRTPQS
jgi:hypothetical protein